MQLQLAGQKEGSSVVDGEIACELLAYDHTVAAKHAKHSEVETGEGPETQERPALHHLHLPHPLHLRYRILSLHQFTTQSLQFRHFPDPLDTLEVRFQAIVANQDSLKGVFFQTSP